MKGYRTDIVHLGWLQKQAKLLGGKQCPSGDKPESRGDSEGARFWKDEKPCVMLQSFINLFFNLFFFYLLELSSGKIRGLKLLLVSY